MPNFIDVAYADLKCDGTIVDPFDSYVRIARVEEVRTLSREMIVQFIDGDWDTDESAFVEGPETATCVVGSDDPSTTFAPSCTVYGKGDLCAAIVLRNGDVLCASLLDLYEDVNRKNFALVRGWALYDVLGGMLLDFLDDTTTPENSYLELVNIHPHPVYPFLTQTTVTKIKGDPTKRHVMRRMLDYFGSQMTHSLPITTTDDPLWEWDRSKSGPDNNPMRRLHGRTHKGYRISGFPMVCDVDFTNDVATLENNIVAYHSTLEDLKTGDTHPLQNGDTLNRYWEHTTVVWWNDEEPTHVVLIGSYPAWDTAKYILFLEVPVYSMAGRKMLEREIIDEGLPTEERNIITSWQLYGEHVRVLKTIDRSTYVDWLAHETDIDFSERMHKGVVAHLPFQPGEETKDFGILDGYGWAQSGTVLGVNKVKKIQGTIQRVEKAEEDPTEANGSRWDYTITNNDPATTGNLDLSYSINFVYEYNGGDEYETQVNNNPSKEYNCYTDGVNSMEKTIDFDYHCDGIYQEAVDYGRVYWSDGGSMAAGNQIIKNEFWHRLYRNGGHVHTDYWHFEKDRDGQTGWMIESTFYVLFYADVEYDLFCFLKVVTDIPKHLGTGPGFTFQDPLGTHRQKQYGIVIFEGVEWTLWEYDITLVTFPGWWNFFPWVMDSGAPKREDYLPPPYSVDTDHTSYFMYAPTIDYQLGTLKTGYSTVGFGYPAPYFGPESIQTWGAIKTDDFSQPDDLLQVSIDYDSDSFIVRWDSFYVNDTNKVLTYPNGDTLMSFDGETPHFNKPAVTSIIDLSI